ncbi:MAG: hypothetical protein II718_07295 [Clostridiales bacterium]|nr:hypothetical protein [Clostridiales bacterium]
MILAIIEGLVLSFILLLVCVINIQNGPVGGVHYYEEPVKERVVEMGLITKAQIKKNMLWSGAVFMSALLIAAPLAVFFVNKATGFTERFIQLTIMYLVCGLFDRLFIDWYWVGHTKAWIIPGTEDLMPYIHKKSWIKKWIGTCIGYPVFAAILAGLMQLLG